MHEKQESVGVTTQGAAEMVRKIEIRPWKCLEGVTLKMRANRTSIGYVLEIYLARATDLYETSILNLTAAEHV